MMALPKVKPAGMPAAYVQLLAAGLAGTVYRAGVSALNVSTAREIALFAMRVYEQGQTVWDHVGQEESK